MVCLNCFDCNDGMWDEILVVIIAGLLAACLLACFVVPDYIFYKRRQDAIPTADVCHIQVDTEEEANQLKAIIQEGELEGEYSRFCTVAQVRSTCDSKKKNGNLGRIYLGSLELPEEFLDACFYEKVWTTLGPVKSEYGYHLIFVRERSDPTKMLSSKAQFTETVKPEKLKKEQ